LLLMTAAAILALRHPSIDLSFLRAQTVTFSETVSADLQHDRDWLLQLQWRKAFQQEQQMTFSQRMNRWHVLIAEASDRFHLPAKWIRTVIQMESGGRTMLNASKPITSPVGAVGLMQLMPGTYDQMRRQNKLGANPFNPHDNIMAGAAYLSWLHHRYGYPAMFVAYNDGPGNLEAKRSKGRAFPVETRNYVAAITGSTVEEWANAGRNGKMPERAATSSCRELMALLKRAPNPFVTELEQHITLAAAKLWGVQLAAGFSRDKALAMYARAMKRLNSVIGDQDPSLLSSVMRSRGTRAFYQVRIGADTRPAADDLCNRIRRAGGACFVLRNMGVRG
jgi:hypothetical protein